MKRTYLNIVFLLLIFIPGNAQVVINEVMAYNTSTILNPQLDLYSDWIEIYNTGDTPYDLTFCYLSDRYDNLDKWKFPAGTIIGPDEYLIIWADNPEYPFAGLHASFKLNVAGESLYLTDQLIGKTLDSLTYSRQFENTSYGKTESQSHAYFSVPTPEAVNQFSSGYLLAAGIQFDPPPGMYASAQNVALSWSGAGATIRYTLDGSEPDESSDTYFDPIHVNSNTVIRTKIWAPEHDPGWIETGTYLIGQSFNLPVFSLVTDPSNLWDDFSGIYIEGLNGITGYCSDQPRNYNQDWERPVSMEYFDLSGDHVLQMDGGTKIFGGCSRAFEMKSLSFYARNEYGANEIRYPFFREKDIDWFKDLVFRNSGNDFQHTLIRDGVMQAVVKGQMDVDVQAFEPAHIFLNGEYWGIHNLREKLNEHYINSNYGIPAEEIDFIKNRNQVFAGSYTNYSQLNNYLTSHSLTSQEDYKWVTDRIDVDEYMNYLMTQMFFANDDWPGNNLKYWRPNTADGKWRWILFDTDFGMGLYDFRPSKDMFTFTTEEFGPGWPNPPWSTLIIRRLFENAEFKEKFILRYMMHLNTTFQKERIIQVVDSIYGMIANDFPLHIDRWNQPWSIEAWESNIERLREYARMRPDFVWQNMRRFFSLGDVISIDIENTDTSGIVWMNGFELPSDGFSGKTFEGYPIELEAIPAPGNAFFRWEIAPSEFQKVEFISHTAVWKYFDKGYLPGTDWNLPGFNDASWDQGQAELGYGDGGEATVLDYGPDPGNKYITSYFRKEFELTDTSGFTGFLINLMRDDGAVVYINGEKVLSSNMLPGDIGYNTYASNFVGGDEESNFLEYQFDELPVHLGTNTIAVEIHQSGPESSDISFALGLSGFHYITGETEYLSGSRITYEPSEGISIKSVFKTADEIPILIINEFMASNQTAYQDEAGDFEDWIEILNTGQQVVNLGGFYLTDDLNDPFKYKIPDTNPEQTTIHPGEYLVLFADQDTLQGPLHLNFRLDVAGEEIGISTIFQDEFTWLDTVLFASQTADLSFGRFPDGDTAWKTMVDYTPGATNFWDPTVTVPRIREFRMKLYPNPAGDLVSIHIQGYSHNLASKGLAIRLYDIAGRLILKQDLFNPAPDFTHTLDLSKVPSGFYMLKAGSRDQEIIERLIIQ